MNSSTVQTVVTLAKEIESKLITLRKGDANFAALHAEATSMVGEAKVPELHMAHPQVVFHGAFGVALRIQLLNGKPHPVATAWVPVPKEWMPSIH